MKGYYDFITECKDKNYPEGSYLEKHHIVPRSLGGSDDEDNLILLTPEDHYTAHEWLDLMYPNTGMFSWFAGRVDKFQYGEERRRWALQSSEYRKNNPLGEEVYAKISEKNRGKVRTDVSKQRYSVSKKAERNPLFKVKPWLHPRANHSMWLLAGIAYEFWVQNKPTPKPLSDKYSLSWRTAESMIKLFKNGWDPRTDKEWLNWSKNYER
ncbi:HNH homing endonuclease [Salmonella phage Maynard]|uniref:HNH homing endonuclease n=2 Tax=Kuttervirus TaxID=2169536 RepID=U5PYW2_9CAUD|nr:homing endonuclease [Salmonella phage Maynard]YP_008771698.1 homing endonuclease [Salmonella phage Marshall]AGY47597.1 HNH homing endonuclease [Salmonella phage Marshall]AGY47802.1 HNH homing endonuclease [Salmonella phage Maynard]